MKRMTIYEPNIDEWIYLIKGNHIEHCREQELALENNIIPVLERPDVYVDAERIRKGLSLQKYFDFNLLAWERYQFAIMFGLFLRVPGAPYDDIYFHVTRDIMGRGSGKNGFIDFCALYMISPLHGVKGYNVDLIANGEDQAGTSIKDLYNLIKYPVKDAYSKSLNANFKAMVESITGKKMKAEFRLNHPVFPFHIILPVPEIEIAGKVQSELLCDAHFDAQVNGGGGVIQKIGLDTYFLRLRVGRGE